MLPNYVTVPYMHSLLSFFQIWEGGMMQAKRMSVTGSV